MTGSTAAAPRPAELWAALGAIALATAAYLPFAREAPPPASGLFGHGLGIAGFLLMLFAETAYTWRKRVDREGRGPLRRWMQAHVFAGLVGPYLVLLHTAFEFRGLAGVTALLVAVVVASGIVGRFAFTSVPKTADARPRGPRRLLSFWYVLHVPLAAAMFVLALVHVAAALYYATLLR